MWFCILCGRVRDSIDVHHAFWYVVLVCHQYDVCKKIVGSVYVGGYGGLSEGGLKIGILLNIPQIQQMMPALPNMYLQNKQSMNYPAQQQMKMSLQPHHPQSNKRTTRGLQDSS